MKRLKQPYRIHKVVCGPDSTFIILENGQLYACGNNNNNKLGLGNNITMADTLVSCQVEG